MPSPVLVDCHDLAKGFGGVPLFEGLSLVLHEGDHVGLVGPNGAGKSTLLEILAGRMEPDAGEVRTRKGIRVGYVPQDPVFAPGKTVEEVLLDAMAESTPDVDEGTRFTRLAVALGKAGFDDREERTETLSGGWRKRLGVARELALDPDVLLLDEPTNHLDLESIVWLEELLRSEPEAFVAVSHDRYFLEGVARRVLDLDRRYPEGIFAVDGGYADFLLARNEKLRRDEAYRSTLANLARREAEWLRRGPKARTTKSKARIDAAGELFDELASAEARRERSPAGIDFTASGRRTKRLWRGEGLAKRFGERTIFRDLDLLLGPGDRLGVLGRNGSGKTTFLRVLVGELEPDEGTIETADGLRVVYFEQNRESLDPELTLERALSPRGDHVEFQGQPIHVAGWASRFLFRSEQLRTPVAALSGGEKARIVLARLMLRPADLLVLDEPTNDLDIPTLDVLEEALLEFAGAVVLVTHDRFLLDRVSTRVLALDGEGGVERYADVSQYLEARRRAERAEREARAARTPSRPARDREGAPAGPGEGRAPAAGRKKLSYREQREWKGMEEAVLAAEEALGTAERAAADPAIASDSRALQERWSEVEERRGEVERLYSRWAELEEMKGVESS